MRHFCALLIGTAILTSPAKSQTPQPDVVSRRLVEEISGGDTLRIGQLPPKLQDKFYLPPTSRVIGSLGSAAVIVSSLPVEQTLKDLEREMPKRGWKLLLHSRPDWGFVFPTAAVGDHGLMFCGNDTWLVVVVVPSAERGTRLRLTAQRGGPPGECDHAGLSVSGGAWRIPPTYDPVPLRLINPTESRAQAFDACQRWTDNNVGQTILETPLSVDSLLTWYGKQLDSAGWAQTKPGGAFRSWTRADSAGKLFRVDLRIQGVADLPRCKEAFYQIRPVTPPLSDGKR